MYCSRYNRNCEEAIFLCCDVPRINGEQTGEKCTNCVFCEERKLINNEKI